MTDGAGTGVVDSTVISSTPTASPAAPAPAAHAQRVPSGSRQSLSSKRYQTSRPPTTASASPVIMRSIDRCRGAASDSIPSSNAAIFACSSTSAPASEASRNTASAAAHILVMAMSSPRVLHHRRRGPAVPGRRAGRTARNPHNRTIRGGHRCLPNGFGGAPAPPRSRHCSATTAARNSVMCAALMDVVPGAGAGSVQVGAERPRAA